MVLANLKQLIDKKKSVFDDCGYISKCISKKSMLKLESVILFC